MAQIGEPDRWWDEPTEDPWGIPLPDETPIGVPTPEPVLVPA